MTINKLAACCGGLVCLATALRAENLTFIAQFDTNTGTTNYSWFSADNWFYPDAGGSLAPAGRVPAPDDLALVTGTTDAGASGIRVQTLVLTNNASLTNGTIAMESLQMLSGSGFRDANVNVLVSLLVGGTNCFLNGTSLKILSTATATFSPISPATSVTLNLIDGTLFNGAGITTLSNGTYITSVGQPPSTLMIPLSALLRSSGQCQIKGDPTSHLIIDNSSTIQASDGTLTFEDGIDWRSSSGLGEFRAAGTNALLLFQGPFQVPTGVTTLLTGAGTNRFAGGATVDGTAQVGGNDPNAQEFHPGNLELTDSVGGAGNLHVLGAPTPAGVVVWRNGNLSLPEIDIDPGGQLLLNGGPGMTRQLMSGSINNSGLTRLLSGDFAINPGATFNNLVTATFELVADATFYQTSTPGQGDFRNSGTFRKLSAGTSQFSGGNLGVGPDFNNTGLIDVESGQLNLLGGSSSGEFRCAAGAQLWFWGGLHALNPGASFTGDGPVTVGQGESPASWLLEGTIPARQLEIRFNGSVVGSAGGTSNALQVGTLSMRDNASITNESAIVSQTLTLSGTNCVLADSRLSLLPSASADFRPLPLSPPPLLSLVQGASLLDAGQLRLADGAQISGGGLPQSMLWILPGGILNATNLGAVQGSNSGRLICDNSGLIRAEAGLLRFGDGLDWKCSAGVGEFLTVAPTAVISFDGTFQVQSGTTNIFAGLGTNRWSGGGTIDGLAQVGAMDPVSHLVSPANLELWSSYNGSGVIQVLGDSTQAAVLAWQDGTLGVTSVNIHPGGEMLIGGVTGSGRQLSGTVLNNSGRCTLWSGDLGLGQGAAINNLAGGVFDLQTDSRLTVSSGVGGGVVNNAGNFLKSGGGGVSSVASAFNNSGLCQVNSGTLDFSGSWIQTDGITSVALGADLAGTVLNLQGGTLTGAGTISALLSNSAFVSPGGSPGTLRLGPTNDYQQSAAGTLEIEIAGTSSSQCDQLAIGGRATLGGDVELEFIKGYVPTAGDQFQLLTCGSLAGGFTRVFASAMPEAAWVTRYTATNVTLLLVKPVHLIPSRAADGSLAFPLETVPGCIYLVQYSETSTPANWLTLTRIVGDGATVEIADPIKAGSRFYRVVMQ